jgi:hypothetical protein
MGSDMRRSFLKSTIGDSGDLKERLVGEEEEKKWSDTDPLGLGTCVEVRELPSGQQLGDRDKSATSEVRHGNKWTREFGPRGDAGNTNSEGE